MEKSETWRSRSVSLIIKLSLLRMCPSVIAPSEYKFPTNSYHSTTRDWKHSALKYCLISSPQEAVDNYLQNWTMGKIGGAIGWNCMQESITSRWLHSNKTTVASIPFSAKSTIFLIVSSLIRSKGSPFDE